MIIIDYNNRNPIYEQIAERFQLLIIKGVLEAGTQMPSVRSLAVELSINPNTIQRAYAMLEHSGFIYAVKGKGNFVANVEEVKKKEKQSFMKELELLLLKGKDLGAEKGACIHLIEQCWEEKNYD